LLFFKSSSPEPTGQIQSNLIQIIVGWREFKFVQLKGQVLFKGNHKNGMSHGHLEIFSRTTGQILTRLGTNHPLVKGIQVCSNEGDIRLQGEIIAKE
jgi:hypothetical protein